MSRNGRREKPKLGDQLALAVQQLRSVQNGEDRPLLKIDNRQEAAKAPYQFDSIQGRLHRRGCRSIPKSSRSALYGMWQVGPEERRLACPQCRPEPTEGNTSDDSLPTDLLYGLLSIFDQFGNALQERGREYRKSRQGRRLRADLDQLFGSFGGWERDILDIAMSVFDDVARSVRDLDNRLNGGDRCNGSSSRNGANGSRRRK